MRKSGSIRLIIIGISLVAMNASPITKLSASVASNSVGTPARDLPTVKRVEAGKRAELSDERRLAVRNVVAQETVAKWIEPQFWTSILQALVSALGFGAVILSLRQGRSAHSVAKLSLNSSRNEARPWLDPDVQITGQVLVEDGIVTAPLSIKLYNRGRTPAHHARLGIAGIRKRPRQAENIEPVWTTAKKVIDMQTKQGRGHAIFPDKFQEFVPVLRFKSVMQPSSLDDPIELFFVILIDYEWDHGERSATTTTCALEPVDSDLAFSISAILLAGGVTAKIRRYYDDDTHT